MKKAFVLFSLLAVTCLILGPVAMAQENSSDTFTLEEITVTAEKRSENLQKLASSVVALPGDTLATMGKTSTAEMLDTVPNVRWDTGGQGNTDNNISIRGIQRTQAGSIDNNVLPATTAVYVDGVYQGIGGQMDVNRVEVLRGPQGTLYGRSATGGVVAFYTNDPHLGQFEGSARFEVGSNNLINTEDVINIPIGDKVAVRAAGHYYRRDGYFDAQGGEVDLREGRIKVLYQPTDALNFILAGSIKRTQDWNGGWSIAVVAPGEIDYHSGNKLDYVRDAPRKYNQISLTTNYDLGNSALTWIAAYHDYEYFTIPAISYLGPATNNMQVINYNNWPTYNVHTEELRWQSNTDGRFTWLIGANYFYEEYDNQAGRTQVYAVDMTGGGGAPIDEDVPFNTRNRSGTTKAYGLFTEETFKLTDDLRITAGLRFDKTKCVSNFLFIENFNFPYYNPVTGDIGEPRANPPIWAGANAEGKVANFTNVTYKLRFEYDLTPNSMVYAMTATGFLPGSVQITPTGIKTNDPDLYFAVRQWDQQKLTSYEIGTKNQFLNNHLRVNGDIFFYDQSGWPNNYNVNIGSGRPANAYLVIGNNILGLEADIEWLMTMNDRLQLNVGYLKTDQKDYPKTVGFITGAEQIPGTGQDAIYLDETPGFPEWEATLTYSHMFALGDGSTLVPRVEFNYKDGHYTNNLNKFDYEAGLLPMLWQDSVVLCNWALSWTSASQKYTANLWMRNAFDKEYVISAPLRTSAQIGDPRTFGLSLSAKF